MYNIDLDKIRNTLPKHGTAKLYKKLINGKTVCFIECWVKNPSLSEMSPMTYENDFEMIKNWQRQIVGEALSEFFTEQTGHEWRIYLKRVPINFINASDDDIMNYIGV